MSDGEDAARITRRTALRGAAAAGAASLLGPAGALGAVPGVGSPRAPAVFSRWVGAVAGGSAVVAAPRRFALVGAEWSAPARPLIELRTRSDAGGAWSPWVVASAVGHGLDRRSGRVTDRGGHFGEAIWTGEAAFVEVRTASAVRGVRLHFVAPGAGAVPVRAHAAQALPIARPVLDAGPGQPPIIARSAWAQARAPHHAPYYGTVKLAIVHHSQTANGYGAGEVPSILMSIYAYHRYVRGFFDIAYNFAVDAFGRIWEARAGGVDLPVVGAHAGGYNEESTGMVVLGSFSSVVPSPAAIGALEHLLAWKLSLHGLPVVGRVTVEVASYDAFYTPFPPGALVSLPRVAGHRDGDQTSCPGDALYARLPSIRPRAATLAGSPARMTISAAASTVDAGASVALSGRLAELQTGKPLPGEPVELQTIDAGAEKTVATLTTGADGSWSSTFTPAGNTLVRALHRPAPAAASDLVQIAVVPVITLTVNSQSPLVQLTGTVSPARRSVTVDLYALRTGHRRLVGSKSVPATSGKFTARFRSPRPGRYVLIAKTPATALYAPASTAPVALTIP